MTRLNALMSAAGLAAMLAFTAQAQAETIALVTINQQALFFNQINQGAQKAADAAGAKLVIFNANNVPSAQNDAIETYITQKVDGIVLVAIDVNGVKPAITAAKQAGIPVIAVDAQIPDGDNAAFVGVDNLKAGEEIGKHTAEYVKASMGGSAKLGVIGALNSFIQNQRLDGFKKAVSDSDIEARIAEHCAKHGIDPLTAVKNFAVLARRQALKRFLAHVELFKMTLDVPGDIAEFGVFRGLGLFTWANLL